MMNMTTYKYALNKTAEIPTGSVEWPGSPDEKPSDWDYLDDQRRATRAAEWNSKRHYETIAPAQEAQRRADRERRRRQEEAEAERRRQEEAAKTSHNSLSLGEAFVLSSSMNPQMTNTPGNFRAPTSFGTVAPAVAAVNNSRVARGKPEIKALKDFGDQDRRLTAANYINSLVIPATGALANWGTLGAGLLHFGGNLVMTPLRKFTHLSDVEKQEDEANPYSLASIQRKFNNGIDTFQNNLQLIARSAQNRLRDKSEEISPGYATSNSGRALSALTEQAFTLAPTITGIPGLKGGTVARGMFAPGTLLTKGVNTLARTKVLPLLGKTKHIGQLLEKPLSFAAKSKWLPAVGTAINWGMPIVDRAFNITRPTANDSWGKRNLKQFGRNALEFGGFLLNPGSATAASLTYNGDIGGATHNALGKNMMGTLIGNYGDTKHGMMYPLASSARSLYNFADPTMRQVAGKTYEQASDAIADAGEYVERNAPDVVDTVTPVVSDVSAGIQNKEDPVDILGRTQGKIQDILDSNKEWVGDLKTLSKNPTVQAVAKTYADDIIHGRPLSSPATIATSAGNPSPGTTWTWLDKKYFSPIKLPGLADTGPGPFWKVFEGGGSLLRAAQQDRMDRVPFTAVVGEKNVPKIDKAVDDVQRIIPYAKNFTAYLPWLQSKLDTRRTGNGQK